MAHVVVYLKDQEIARQRLEGSVTIGRSPECELSVHDILLSRKHCRIEPEGDGWAVMDLGSKNGTSIGGTPVFRLPLNDGDVIRMGKTAVRFRIGEMIARPKSTGSSVKRPADPFEAMAGTVTDFSFKPPKPIAPNGIPFPTPKPVPLEPAAYADEEVRSLVSQLVSSSWDSMYESAKNGNAKLAHRSIGVAARQKLTRQPKIDLSLQVREEPETPATVASEPGVIPSPPPENPTAAQLQPANRRNVPTLVRSLATIFQWLALLLITQTLRP